MSRRLVNVILIAHLLVVWSAVVFRIDRFPLTWAPMYSTFSVKSRVGRRIEDQDRARRGLRVTHRDGTKSTVGFRELNISKWIMARLYFQRAFEKGPVKHKQGNTNLGALNRWAHGIEGDEPRFEVDWEQRLFWTVNKTLGHAPDDPGFVVQIRAQEEKVYYDPATLQQVDRKKNASKLVWKEEWREWWDDGPP